MVNGLSRVSWEKVDVSFHNSLQWPVAHSIIQVLSLSLSLCHTHTHTHTHNSNKTTVLQPSLCVCHACKILYFSGFILLFILSGQIFFYVRRCRYHTTPYRSFPNLRGEYMFPFVGGKCNIYYKRSS